MKALGLDLSVRSSGWAMLRKLTKTVRLKGYGSIVFAKNIVQAERESSFYQQIRDLIITTDPDIVVIEDLYCRNRQIYKALAINIGIAKAAIRSVSPTIEIRLLPAKTIRKTFGIKHTKREEIKVEVCNTVNATFNTNFHYNDQTPDDDMADAILTAWAIIVILEKERDDKHTTNTKKRTRSSKKKIPRQRRKRQTNRDPQRPNGQGS